MEDRRRSGFGIEAAILAALLLTVFAGHSYLRMPAAMRLLVDGSSGVDLSDGARGPVERSDGVLIVRPPGDEAVRVRLPEMMLDPDERYLLIARVDRGRAVRIVGKDLLSETRVNWRLPVRGEIRTYRTTLEFGADGADLRWALLVPGPEPLRVERLAIYRLSPLRQSAADWLPLLPWLLIGLFVWRHRRGLLRGLVDPHPADDAVFAAALFVLCLVAFHRAPVQQMMDGRQVTVVSHSLIHHGSLAVPEEAVELTADGVLPYWLQWSGGKIRHFSYTPVAVLNAPFVWAYERLGVSVMSSAGFDGRAELGILRAIAALLSAAFVVVLYGLARLRLAPVLALACAVVFAFGTQVFSTVSRPYWSHPWAMLLMGVAILMAMEPKLREGRLSSVIMALLVAVATVCRPSMVVSGLAVAALLWLPERARHRWLFVGSLAGLGALALVGFRLALGSFLPIHLARFHGSWSLGDVVEHYPAGFLGTLVSPARGVLVYVPLFAWILWMTWRLRRELTPVSHCLVATLAIALHWQLLAVSRVWPDGQAYGSRLFSDVVVWFFVLGVMVLAARRGGPGHGGRRLEWGLLVAALGLSLFINARGALAPATWHWRWTDRPPQWLVLGDPPPLRRPAVWHWGYPQFMAGLLPIDPNGDALAQEYQRRRAAEKGEESDRGY